MEAFLTVTWWLGSSIKGMRNLLSVQQKEQPDADPVHLGPALPELPAPTDRRLGAAGIQPGDRPVHLPGGSGGKRAALLLLSKKVRPGKVVLVRTRPKFLLSRIYFFLGVCFPAAIILVCYAGIYVAIKRSGERLKRRSKVSGDSTQPTMIKVA